MLSLRLQKRKLSWRLLSRVMIGVLVSVIAVNSLTYISTVNAVQPIVFPVIGQSSFSNDYNAGRSNGPHHAIDIIANKGQKIVAAMSGTISYIAYPQPSWGYAIYIDGDDGYSYNYLHINNDTPGTDDGNGGGMNAYAPDVRRGNRVIKGQLLGWVGDSGNAENTVSHLHFEMENSAGNRVNPYLSLVHAQRLNSPKDYPALEGEILPYGSQDRVRINVAMGDIDGDGDDEVITGVGPGGKTPHVKIFKRDGTLVVGFNSYYSSGYKSGADIAAGDFDGDGVDEIVTGTGTGASPGVKAYHVDEDKTVREVGNFLSYDESAKSGLSIAAGDVDGDGKDEIVTVQRAGSNSNIKIFKLEAGMATLHKSFYAYLPSFMGGTDITVADVTGDGREEVITIPISNGSPDVRIYDEHGEQLGRFFAYDTTYRRGSRISAGNLSGAANSKAEIVVVPVDATSHVKMFGSTGTLINERWLVEEWWRSTFDIAAGEGESVGSVGVNRRTAVKPTSITSGR